jgi:hypothetical protein
VDYFLSWLKFWDLALLPLLLFLQNLLSISEEKNLFLLKHHFFELDRNVNKPTIKKYSFSETGQNELGPDPWNFSLSESLSTLLASESKRTALAPPFSFLLATLSDCCKTLTHPKIHAGLNPKSHSQLSNFTKKKTINHPTNKL